jgi:hypothetical protein
MRNILLISFISIFTLSSCDEIDNAVLPILGTYRAKINADNRPFVMTVYGDRNDDIEIEAPFDGDVWSLVKVDIDNPYDIKWDLDIHRQSISPGIEIWGDGFFFDGTIQLDYTISFDGDKYKYRIIASR